MKKKEKKTHPTIENRQARYLYHIEDTMEAGLELKGSEVKSIRLGQVSLNEGYCVIKKDQLYLSNVHIAPYKTTNAHDLPPSIRDIRLLMHKKEIMKVGVRIDRERLSLVPMKMYFKDRYIKILLGLGKGKKLHDKRESKKKQDVERKELKNIGKTRR